MQYTGPYCYHLSLAGEEQSRFIKKKTYKGVVTNLKSPVTLKHRPKIYIIKHNKEIVYVGYASQSIGVRLGQGIRAKGTHGYYGYKWKQCNELKLYVFVFDQLLKGNKHKDDKPYIDFTKAVEAEIVCKIRQETGKWPKFQNEIHFNNTQLELATAIAETMYEQVTTNYV